MSYVDGYVIPIPKKNLAAYRKLAKLGARLWMKAGALQYFECVGDDLKVPCGRPFPKLAKPKPGETVLFSFIIYKSRAHRDAVNAKVMKGMEKMGMPDPFPFDMKRMSFGGFKTLVEA